jgi:hypothetical protein
MPQANDAFLVSESFPGGRSRQLRSSVTMASESIAKQIAGRLGSGRLYASDGRVFELVLTHIEQVRPRTGWLQFALSVRDQEHWPARTPLMTGIISSGGRGVMPWIEGSISTSLEFANQQRLDARAAGLEAELIKLIGDLIPAGGHLLLDYESPGQSETHRELLLRVPPAATHLGALMFTAGFRGYFKDWYISEGGHEGPRKLQANKSPNLDAAREALQANLEELERFVHQRAPENSEDAALVGRSQERARAILKEFGARAPRGKSRASAKKRR